MKKIFKDYLQEKPTTILSVAFTNNDKPKCRNFLKKDLGHSKNKKGLKIMLNLNNYYIKNEYDKYEAAIIEKAAYFDMNKNMDSPYSILY